MNHLKALPSTTEVPCRIKVGLPAIAVASWSSEGLEEITLHWKTRNGGVGAQVPLKVFDQVTPKEWDEIRVLLDRELDRQRQDAIERNNYFCDIDR